MRNDKRKSPGRGMVRRLKIQYKSRPAEGFRWVKVPEITFSGQWLQELGFEYGRNITVTSLPRMIIIQATDE